MAHEMGIFEVMYNCRAMRRLKQDPVPEELLVKLIDAANHGPSGSNSQPARWIERSGWPTSRLRAIDGVGAVGWAKIRATLGDANVAGHRRQSMRSSALSTVAPGALHFFQSGRFVVRHQPDRVHVRPGPLLDGYVFSRYPALRVVDSHDGLLARQQVQQGFLREHHVGVEK